MSLYNIFVEPIIAAIIFAIGIIIYVIATRKSGSFTQAPNQSKVVKRIVELVCVFVWVLIVSYSGWEIDWLVSWLVIIFPVFGIITVPIVLLISKVVAKKAVPINEKIGEHLANSLILAIFLLSGMLTVSVAFAKIHNHFSFAIYLHVLLDLLLSFQISLLLYQLYYYLFEKEIPSGEEKKIQRICNELID